MPVPSTANLNLNLSLTELCREGLLKEALHILLTLYNAPTNFSIYIQLLQTCISKKALLEGKQIHSHINERNFEFATCKPLQNTLIRMYDKCGSLVDARQVFDQMNERDGFSWNIIISAYQRHGYPHEALTMFHRMQPTGVWPDQFTYPSILKVCAEIRDLEQGMDFHQSILERGFLSDDVVANALVDMYAKCGNIYKAREVFEKIAQKNVVSWTAMISGYVQNGFCDKALETFKQMQSAGVKPNSMTFASVLPACGKIGAFKQGTDIHQIIMERGFFSDVVVTNALIHMYAKCGSIHKARHLFDKMCQKNVVSWTAMIAGYAQNGVLDEALRLFKEMPKRNVISWNAMIAGYAHNGIVAKAMEIFKDMQLAGVKPNSTTFASILPACAKMGVLGQGYTQNGFVEIALEAFKQMLLAGVKPASTTFTSILSACAKMGALGQGAVIHKSIIEEGISSEVEIANALVDMYCKCGSIYRARGLFDQIPQKNVVSWTAMITGYAQNGFSKDALKLFELMKQSRTYPDHVSFACVLLACNHAGLVDEGCKYFNCITDSYCITPTIDHYVCMVDLLGRAGYLEATLNFIIKMPIKPVAVVWTCLLRVCRAHKNISLGVFTATLLFELDSKNPATYVLLSNIYAEVGKWGEVQKVRRLMKDKGIKKIPGCSWIESH
ncbi:pentatricopeptide repeat-containing protein At1g15510, chloroplastic isoform X1 [Cryptomeria japonica]|uniref:pentatricopeptide repeat-containing protein At1g15510, chloroplastic isoform X1 n=1 Tax=Cryptomeria japonica TaxID=3369 RepID=UPI0027DA05BF|nr:pentatricopeptide repeat-containing protein At1g15510, chloroplastic isoform X1 [Cryptomeria japonica]